MADKDVWPAHQQSGGSAVIELDSSDEMEIVDEEDTMTFDSQHYSNNGQSQRRLGDEKLSYMEQAQKRVTTNITDMMWQAGRQKASEAWNVYGKIDYLRPYFDVEPKEVTWRLLYSLFPQFPTTQRQRVHRELYGPVMLILTLVALLLFQMKTSDHQVQDGTLIGTAFGVCIMYWIGASCCIWFLSYVCNTHISLIQLLSLLGYALFSHCIVIFLGTMVHTSHDHMLFYILWATIGGLSALRMISVIVSRTHGKTQRLVICSCVAALHMMFLLYLHFAYHKIVEEISEVFESPRNEGIPLIEKAVDISPDRHRIAAVVMGKIPLVETTVRRSIPVQEILRNVVVPAANQLRSNISLVSNDTVH